jgi:hypothetical protein
MVLWASCGLDVAVARISRLMDLLSCTCKILIKALYLVEKVRSPPVSVHACTHEQPCMFDSQIFMLTDDWIEDEMEK